MPDKLQMERAGSDAPQPMVLAIAGDSAAGKTTLTEGLVKAWDADWITSLCVELPTLRPGRTKGLPFPALHPGCNYVPIMEQHLAATSLRPQHSSGAAPARAGDQVSVATTGILLNML